MDINEIKAIFVKLQADATKEMVQKAKKLSLGKGEEEKSNGTCL